MMSFRELQLSQAKYIGMFAARTFFAVEKGFEPFERRVSDR